MSATRAILARGLCRTFRVEGREIRALQGVDLQIAPGESVAIVGRSGAGKSTLLNLIGALDRGYTGHLEVFGQALHKLADRDLSRFRNRQIGFVFQSFNLLTGLTVGDNVMLPASFGVDLPAAEVRRRAEHLLGELGLGDRFGQMPAQMSGGERQRVAIARALLLQPPLLVCDEPTGALDAQTSRQLLHILAQMRDKFGTALVIVTHDPAVAATADRTVILDKGRIAQAGEPAAAGAAP